LTTILAYLTIYWLPTWCTNYYLFIKYYSPLHVSSLKCSSSGGYSCTRAAYGTVILYESSWWPVGTQRNVEENIILWINNNWCIKLVINIYSIHDARSEKHQDTRIFVVQVVVSLLDKGVSYRMWIMNEGGYFKHLYSVVPVRR